ncbi:hypothetical protein Tco_0182802, partial [Tanacetum coccineum]
GHGKQIKIRLLKKPRGPEPGVDASLSNVGGVETPVRALNSVQVPGVAGRNMVASNGRTSVPTTSGRENVAPQARQFNQIMSGPIPPNHLKHEVLSSHFKKAEVLPVLSQSRQNDVKLGQFSRQRRGRPVVPQGRLVNDVPSSSLNLSNAPSVTRRIDVQGPRFGGQQVAPNSATTAVPSSSSLNLSNAPSVTRRIDVQGPRF